MPTLKYETNEGVVGRTRVGRLAVTAFGAEPAGDAERGIWIYKSGSRRKRQMRTRNLVLRRVLGTVGTEPNEREVYAYARASVGTATAFDAYVLDASIQYMGQTWTIVDKQEEG